MEHETKELLLTQDMITLVDAADYVWLSQFRWNVWESGRTFYVTRNVKLPSGKWSKLFMHREILDAPPDMSVDHIDCNGLNNTRANLRLATTRQNQFNSRSQIGSTSNFKGVCWHKASQKWNAQIRIDGKLKYLGVYSDPEDAARAYDSAAIELYGIFARTNFDYQGIRKAIDMNTTVLLKSRTSGDIYAARLDDHGKVTESIGPLPHDEHAAALAGDADINMHSEDNDWLNENDFELYAVTPPNPEQERADALAELSRRAREMPE